jgi:hypothetical protein
LLENKGDFAILVSIKDSIVKADSELKLMEKVILKGESYSKEAVKKHIVNDCLSNLEIILHKLIWFTENRKDELLFNALASLATSFFYIVFVLVQYLILYKNEYDEKLKKDDK